MVAISRSALFKAFVASSVSTSLHPLETISNQSEYKRYSEPAKFVRQEITNIIQNQYPAIAGSILRLSFHDAAVRSVASDPTIGGADGKILLCQNFQKRTLVHFLFTTHAFVFIFIISQGLFVTNWNGLKIED